MSENKDIIADRVLRLEKDQEERVAALEKTVEEQGALIKAWKIEVCHLRL